MTVAFPNFGPVALVVSKLFDSLEIEYISPERNSNETLKIGAAISPEEMCIPFKYMAGNLKNTYDEGADTALMAATCGPCRLGEYGQLLIEVMAKANCNYRWVLLDSPSDIGIKEFARRFNILLGGRQVSFAKIVKNVFLSLLLVCKIDDLWAKAEARAGYLREPYDAVKLLHKAEKDIEKAEGFKDSFRIIKKAHRELCILERKTDNSPIKILVAGEIYTSVERAANGNLEEKLMALGCSVNRHISVRWWVRHTALQVAIPEFVRNVFKNKKGIGCNIGGYGRESVSKIIRSRRFDGIIKIMPSGCMPEIVTKAFCERLQREQKYKILHLIYDEMSGEAGYETRIEAFIDMLERRKDVLAGDRYRIHKHGLGSYR